MNIHEQPPVCKAAGESGFDAGEASPFLGGEEGRAGVLKEGEPIKRAGVRGEPFFILNGRAFLEGAEPPEAFVQAVGDLVGAKPS